MTLDRTALTGLAAATSAYLLWGFLALYFYLLSDTPPWIILAHRILWSAPTAVLLILASGKLQDAWRAIHQPALLTTLLASGIAIAANWAIYIWAVTQGRILEGSLGYFINPLITFIIASFLFRERFNRLQVAAIILASLGVLNQAVAVGECPWVALALGASFAVYGAIRKHAEVDSRIGFAIEIMWLAPVAAIGLLVWPATNTEILGGGQLNTILLLAAAGPITSIPLILFAQGARRLRLSTTGMLQYIAPTLQFIIGLALGEAFTPAHAVTFGLTWAGVALFTLSSLRSGHHARSTTRT